MNYRNIITIESGKRSGKPCIRGMRITVYDILEYLAGGMTEAEILEDFSELTSEDIKACLACYYQSNELEEDYSAVARYPKHDTIITVGSERSKKPVA